MRDHDGDVRGFFWYERSIYAHQTERPRIGFGLYDPCGGTSGEMVMDWYQFNDGRPAAPRRSPRKRRTAFSC